MSSSDADIVCYILTVDITSNFTRGCFVTPLDRDRQLYMLHSTCSLGGKESICTCAVAPVFADDYPYLCHIADPKNRYEVFKGPHKLKWAKGIKPGDRARAKLRKSSGNNTEEYVAVEVRWVGYTKIGIKFGVEIIDPLYRGQGDASVNNCFNCAEKCGMLLNLDGLECDKLLHPNITFMSKSPATVAFAVAPVQVEKRNEESGRSGGQIFQNTVDKLEKENNQLREELKRERAESKIKQVEAGKQIVALRAQIQRELSLHQQESKETSDEFNAQIKQLMDSEQLLRDELVKKAEYHAAELQEVIEHHREEIQENERKQQNLVRELNKNFQDEIKALHHQWEQAMANTWEIDRNDVTFSDVTIGKGKLGVVVKGHFRGIQVAVKKLHSHLISEENEKLIRWEINLLAQIRHPNLLLFLGAVISTSKDSSFIVTELLSTSLRSAYQRNEIGEHSKIPILANVACTLNYLHTNQVPLIHKLLNSSRVLLEEIGGVTRWKAKLSVFGMANTLPNDGKERDAYSAPEVSLRDSRHVTDRIDVYSFGVLICEVILCRPPPLKAEDFPVMLSDVYTKDRNLFHLAMNCTKQLHNDRPSMGEVIQQLKF